MSRVELKEVDKISKELFDSEQIDKCHMFQRRLKLTNRVSVQKYLRRLEELYVHHKVLEKAQLIQDKLKQRPNARWKEKLFEQLDRLDKLRTNLMIAAEKTAGSPTNSGIYDWSPSLEKAGRIITYWKLRLHTSRQGYVNPQRIARL